MIFAEDARSGQTVAMVVGPKHAAMISELALQRYVGGRIISLEANAATRLGSGGFMSASVSL